MDEPAENPSQRASPGTPGSETLENPPIRSLVFLFLAGPIVWTAHHLIGYLLAEAACLTGLRDLTIVGTIALNFIVIALTVAALAVVVAAGWAAFKRLRSIGMDRPPEDISLRSYFSRDRLAFGYPEMLLYTAILLNGLFGMTILLNGIPALLLRPCLW